MTATEPAIADILDATNAALAVMREHDLHPGSFEIGQGYHNVTQYWRVSLNVFQQPEQFLRCAELLGKERVRIHRREFDTCLHFYKAEHAGLLWSAHSGITRPADGPRLPGITVDWERQPSGRRGGDAIITVAQLRTTLAALGITGGAR